MVCEKEREEERDREPGVDDKKAGGGNGCGEREINGMRKLITSIVVPQLGVEGILEARRNEKRKRRRGKWLKCAFPLRSSMVIEYRRLRHIENEKW